MELLSDLVPRIYDAGCADTSWDEVMSAISQRLGATGHLTYEVVDDPAMGTSSIVSNDGRFGPELMQRYFEHYAGCNIWSAGDAMVPGTVFTSSMLYPDSRLKATEYWSGWLRHADVFYVVGGIVHHDAHSSTKASFVRPENRPRFDAHERHLLESVRPHLHRAMGAHKRLARARALLAPLLHTLDEVDHGVVLLRTDARVLHLNACARELLAGQDRLRLQGDRLELRCPELAARFQALVHPGQIARSGTLDFLLPGAGGAALQASLMRLPDTVAGPQHLALFIRRPRSAGLPVDTLRKLYQLTTAEAELAHSLAQGHTAGDHAQARGISIHTARTQLKAVLSKLGVNRQADVVQIVSGFLRRHRQPR